MDVPASRASGDGWDEVGYPTAGPGRPSFVFPPPRQSSGSPEEYGRVIGEQMREWGDLTESTADEVHNLGVVVADYGDALERKVEPWAVPTVAPLSQTINRRADSTFQLQGFMRTDLPLAGNTRGESGHFHALTGDHANAGRVEGRLAEGWMVGNRTYVAFITPAINRAYEQVSFMVGAVSGTPANMDIAIYVADENKILTSQIGAPRVEGVGLGEELVTVQFDTWVATQGSYIAVAIRQHSAGSQRPILGLHETPRPLSNVVFPRKISAFRHTSTSALPGSMDGETELDFESDWFTPYIELSEAVGIDYRVFTEGWPDTDLAGRPWVALTSTGITSRGGYTSASGNGLRVSMYDTPLSTDHVRVRSSIYNDADGGSARRSTLIVRGTNNLRSGVGLSAISSTRYELIQWTNLAVTSDEDWDDRTVLATIPRIPTTGDQIEIDYLDGDIHVYINGTERITATVTGYSGPSHRFLGIQTRRQSFIAASTSPWFGPWSARDLPQDNGDGDEGDGDEGDDGDGETP